MDRWQVVAVTEAPQAKHHVDDKLQDHSGEPKDTTTVGCRVEAATRLRQEVHALEQGDEQHKTGERGQAVVVEGAPGRRERLSRGCYMHVGQDVERSARDPTRGFGEFPGFGSAKSPPSADR